MVVRSSIALLALSAGFLAAPADAGGPKKFSAELSIRIDSNPRASQARGTVPYVGKLRSQKRACENGREVTLWRITEGSEIKQSQGSSITNGAGKWAVDSQVNPDGEYFATTPKITLLNGNICKRARSESIIRDSIR